MADPQRRLHLITRLGDELAWAACAAEAAAGTAVEVVLLHDAVLEPAPLARDERLVVLAGAEDARRRGVAERWVLVDYAELVNRCVVAAAVVCW